MTIRLAVFDCDGTLVDGQSAVCEAMEAAFAGAGLPLPQRSAVRRIVGLSLPVAIRSLAPEAEDQRIAHAVEAYKAAFFAARQEGRVHEPLFEGVADLLGTLHRAGWRLGVATGKSERGLKTVLSNHGLADLFCTLQTADRHPSKPHPSMLEAALAEALARPEHAVMIGDTAYDIEMARSAGVRAIGVAWGYHAPEELLDAGADAVAVSAAQLGELLA
ncbi:MAG TPA: HAD-IA family hydrolase [Sphingomonadaceae bacterium]|nr:HAD-IA family hydrolase [Sphingomonadaceae bacterium]